VSGRAPILKELVNTAHALDTTRLVSAAMEVHADPANANHRIVDDPWVLTRTC